MPDGDDSGQQQQEITPEMALRWKQERDEARNQLQQLQPTVKDFHLIDRAYEHFKSVEDVKDPYAAARAAVRDVTLKDVDDDQLGDKLTSWLEEQKSLFNPTPSNSQATEGTQPQPEKAATTPPGAARPAPSPANGGGQPPPEPLTWNSPEVQEAVKRGDQGQIQQWIKEGRYQPSAGNPYARQAPTAS